MAQNDIIVAKEGAGGSLSEIALAPSDIGAAAATHASTHHTGGSDAIAPSDIGAQSLFTSASQIVTADVTLSSGRAVRQRLENYDGVTYNVTLPTTDVREGDVFIFTTGTLVGSQTIRKLNFGSNYTTLATISSGQSYGIISTGTNSGSWQIDPVFTHTHAASDITSGTLTHERGGLEADVSAYDGLLKISGGSTSAVTVTTAGEALLDDADAAAQRTTLGLGTAATVDADQDLDTTDDVAFNSVTAGDNSFDEEGLKFDGELRFSPEEGNFYYGGGIVFGASAGAATFNVPIDLGGINAATNKATTRTNLGLGDSAVADIGTGSGDVAAGDHTHELTALDATGATNGHVLTAQGDGTAAFAASGGVTGAASSASDVLGVSGSDITGVDATADRIVFWDDSASKLAYLEVSTGLSLSGTTLTATASGGSKTYAVFSATDNQPPSTAFATLDTRNSIAVLDFDDATDESAVFVSIIPEGASLGSGLKIRLHWMATTATSGNVVWDVSLERMTTDLDSDSFDTIASGTAAANGTSGILTVTEITLTTIDSVTAGDGFRLKVTRDANNASDTMTGDAELVAVEVRSAA